MSDHYLSFTGKKFFELSRFILFIVLVSLAPLGQAAEYPDRGIDIVVPFSPGGGVDNFFRAVRGAVAQELNVPTNIVNRAGGGGVVGTSFVANAQPDGYTLGAFELLAYMMPQIITSKTVPYRMPDLKPIAYLGYEPVMLVVRADLEIQTIEELIAYAKKTPGKLIAATAGLGTLNRINLELFKEATGTNIRFVSFASGGETTVNLLGGHVDLIFGNVVTASRSHIKAGKMRALAVMTPERLSEFPDVPTTKEKGLPQVNLNMDYGFFGPKSLSPEIVEKVSRSVKAALASPENLANLKHLGYGVQYATSKQLEDRLKRDFVFLTDVAKKAGLIQN